MVEKRVVLNGKICLEKQARIPATDRGFLFGEGMFTTIRVHQGKSELLSGHLRRLKLQAAALGFDYAPLRFDWLEELIACNRAEEGIWRLKIIATVMREGESSRLGTLLATLEAYHWQPLEPCALCLYPSPLESPTAHVKSLSYLDHLQVKGYAVRQGCQDAVTTNGKGIVLETGTSNIFWIDREVLTMPHPDLPYLKGVFLTALLDHLPLPVQKVYAAFEDIPPGACVYICNALSHVRPVLSIGSKQFARNRHWEHLLQEATADALQVD